MLDLFCIAGAVFYKVSETIWMEWAKEQGISDGTDAGGSVTRQQLATMLWRFAGCPVPTNAVLKGTDADQVAEYAKQAMA